MKCPNDQCHYFSNVNSDCCYTCGARDLNLTSNLVCPFCKEVDFDLVGLKHHLEEPEPEKIKALLNILRVTTTIKIKNNLNRLTE